MLSGNMGLAEAQLAFSVKYWVKANDIEQACAWVEEAIGLTAEARESSFWGGDYYAFKSSAGEELKLFKNVDVYDGAPIIGTAVDWKMALLFDGPAVSSTVLQALAKHAARFEVMSETQY